MHALVMAMSIPEPASATAVAPAPAPRERKINVKVRYQQVSIQPGQGSTCMTIEHLLHSVLHVGVQYRDERDLATVMDLIDNELSEPYSIFTYRSAGLCLASCNCSCQFEQTHCS